MSAAAGPSAPAFFESPASIASTLPAANPTANGERKTPTHDGAEDGASSYENSRTHTAGTVKANAHGQGHGEEGEVSEEEGNSEEDGEEDEEEEEDDDDDEDDEDEDEEDEEPTLKYERLSGDADIILRRDSASAMAIANKRLAVGTHAGLVHILDTSGTRIKSFKPHSATVVDVCMDETGDYFATASLDGQVVINSISSSETYIFDMKRPMRTVALEPNFAKRGTRAFVCGGMAGTLVMHEKGWLGHKETVLHQGEGPIYQARWRGQLIAWATDPGVRVYDTTSQSQIGSVDRPQNSPHADLFRCNLLWQDDSTLLVAWADYINVARVRTRPPKAAGASANGPQSTYILEITAVFQLDCMIAGIVPHPTTLPLAAAASPKSVATASTTPTAFLILAYSPPDTSLLDGTAGEILADSVQQARKAAERPELRIVSRGGKELAADALGVAGYRTYGCNDYVLRAVPDADDPSGGKLYVVLSPKDIVLVRPRDRRDRVAWLVERRKYEEALEEVERMDERERGDSIDVAAIGQRYIEHLVGEGDYEKAARLCPKVCGQDSKRWEDWIFVFAQKHQLHSIIPLVPTDNPRLSSLVYDMILAHFFAHDRNMLFDTLKHWPKGIYDIDAVIHAVQSELERTSSAPSGRPKGDTTILMECLAELYTSNRQPGKALPYFLRLRRPNVFDLIRENNLFTAVQDQALLLVEFDEELKQKCKEAGEAIPEGPGTAIMLLVDHIHSVPVGRVVSQLRERPQYLFSYLDELSRKDPHIVAEYADDQVRLTAEYAPTRLIEFLRASSYYSLDKALKVCQERDLVPEQVFVLGKMGNNRAALTLIIERLRDVNRAIEFARERRDDDLWEDLLRYSETRPDFIRGLLENVGPDIDPIRLIRRIRNGLEIPGLKEALIKILHDFNLQISFLEGCQTILSGDCADLSRKLAKGQTSGCFLSASSTCPICSLSLRSMPQPLVLLFLCGHVVHASHIDGGNTLPYQPDALLAELDYGEGSYTRIISNKISFAAQVRGATAGGCPVCKRKAEGLRT